MELSVLIVLMLVIISQSFLLYFVLQKNNEEKKTLLDQLKDLTDKVYFTKSEDFISNKIVADSGKEENKENHKEEQFVPLENVDVKDIAEAYGIKSK